MFFQPVLFLQIVFAKFIAYEKNHTRHTKAFCVTTLQFNGKFINGVYVSGNLISEQIG